MSNEKVNRVAVYNDGYNLFNGVYDAGWFDAIWVDLESLGESLANKLPGLTALTAFNHFTARPCAKPEHINPKADPYVFDSYVAANAVSTRVNIIRGRFVHRRDDSDRHEEKQSDVNLAYQLTTDAHFDLYDTAVVISGDTDFARVIRSLNETFADKSFAIASPPGRRNSLAKIFEGEGIQRLAIDRETLLGTQLPQRVIDPTNNKVYRAPPTEFWTGRLRA